MSDPDQPSRPPLRPYLEQVGEPGPGNMPGQGGPPDQPVYQIQPGFEIHTQPHLPPPDLDEHLRKINPTVWMTYVLVAINVIVFILMIARGVSPMSPTIQALIDWGGSLPAKNYLGEPWRLFTACFVHAGIMHIGMNVVGLVILGQRAERMVGPWGFLIAYLASGLLGEIVSSMWNQDTVSVGASGAIFGMVGLQLTILATHPETPLQQALKNAWWAMLSYVGYNLFIGLTHPGIDNAAHLGGLAAGALCGLVLSQPIEESSVENRWLRNACLIVCAVLACGGGYLGAKTFTADVVEWSNAFDEFVQVEPKVLEIFKKALQRAQAGEIHDPELGQIVEKEVLPPWKEVAAKLHATKEPSGRIGRGRGLILAYVDARQQAWEQLADACKETDVAKKDEKIKKFVSSREDAEAKLAAFNSFAKE